MSLGTLKKVELRKAWKNEATDYTNWLAEEKNINLLSDELGIGKIVARFVPMVVIKG